MCVLNLYLLLVGTIFSRALHPIHTKIFEIGHPSHKADFVIDRVLASLTQGREQHIYLFSEKVFNKSRPKIPALKWPHLFVIGTGARCGLSEQRPVFLGRFREFHRCDLLHI